MKNKIFNKEIKLSSEKVVAVLSAAFILLSILSPAYEATAADWYDSDWIYVSNASFNANDVITDCSVGELSTVTANYGGQQYNAWIDLNVPAGNYRVDMKLAYGHTPESPAQYDETMTLYTKDNIVSTITPSTYRDSANIPDMGDAVIRGDYFCQDAESAITTYSNVAGRTLDFPGFGDLFIEGTGSSLLVYAVRIYGYTANPSLIINKSINKSTAVPGEEIIYTIDYQNIGNATATNVVIRDAFDYINQQYLTFVSSVPAPSSGNNTWNLGNIAPGQSGRLTIIARILNTIPSGTFEIKNRASIESNETSLVYSNCANTIVSGGAPSLAITKSVDQYSAAPGDEIVYTLNYENTGDAAATNVVISDPFINRNQNLLTFISSTPSPTSGIDTWSVGTVDPGETGQITIRARISSSLSTGNLEIQNRASIDSDQTSIRYSNFVSTFVSPRISLSISKLGRNITEGTSWADSSSAKIGQRVAFSIELNSGGNVTIQNTIVRDTLPHGLTYVNGSTQVNNITFPDGIVNNGININDILPGETKTIIFEADITDNGAFIVGYNIVTNTAYVSADNLLSRDDIARIVVKKEKPADPNLVLNKSVDKYFGTPGDEIVYTLNYENTGTGTATNVIISDPFVNTNQNFLTFISSTPSPTSGIDTWSVGTVDPGETGQITIRARISSSLSTGNLEIKNVASIDSDETSIRYSNYVSTFVSPRSSLSIKKMARNITKGGSLLLENVAVSPGDEIEFYIEIKSSGNTTINSVEAWDDLPMRLNYIAGSTTIDGSYQSDGITSGGINLGNIDGNTTKIIRFRATVSNDQYFNPGNTILTNFAYVTANTFPSLSDEATITVNKPSGCSPSIHLDKLVKNITQGDDYWTKTVYAEPGDEVEFLIRISSVGSETAQATKIRDQLPIKLTYISGSTRVDGLYKSDGISGSGINLGDIYVGDEIEVMLRAKVAAEYKFTSDSTILTNYAYAWCNKGCQINDTAQVKVEKNRINDSNYELSISKLGKNITKGHSSWAGSIAADPGDEIEFSIQVTNTGNNNLKNVKIWDTLPINLSLIENTTTIDGATWGGSVVGAGINLGSLNKNEKKTIKFRVKIASNDNFDAGSTSLINAAYAEADNTSRFQSQASVIITKSGKVLGATTVSTGVDVSGLTFLTLISCFIAFMLYCRIREQKLLQDLASNRGSEFYRNIIKFYFKIKSSLTIERIRFKKLYL